jgi:hypothetical protein
MGTASGTATVDLLEPGFRVDSPAGVPSQRKYREPGPILALPVRTGEVR